jgi:hypothetical protein
LSDSLGLLKDGVTLVGAGLGVVAFFWRVWDVAVAHVHLIATASTDAGGRFSVSMTVDNKSGAWRRLHYAVLLITPRDVAFEAWAASLPGNPKRSGSSSYRDAMYAIGRRALRDTVIIPAGGALLPLDFFYAQHLHLGLECLHWREEIPPAALAPNERYVVRCVVFTSLLGGLRWRLTTDSFRTPSVHS